MSYLDLEGASTRFDTRFLDTLRNGRWSIGSFVLTLAVLLQEIGVSRIKGRPLVVHLNVSTRGSTYRKWTVSRICAMAGTPYVVHLHGSKYRKFYADAPPIVRRAVLSLFGGAASVIVLGRVWSEYIADVFKVPEDRVVIVPNGTPEPVLAGPSSVDEPSRVQLIFSGRLSVEKGVSDLLDAADLLYRERQDFNIVLMGDSRDSALLDRVRSRPYCRVTGWLPNAEVVQELARADVFILPSHDEGLPMSMIEAMSMGLPLIVTNVGAVSDAVTDGIEGYLIEARDTEKMLVAMQALVSSVDLRREMGRNARRRWESGLQASQMARAIESRWDDVVSLSYGVKG